MPSLPTVPSTCQQSTPNPVPAPPCFRMALKTENLTSPVCETAMIMPGPGRLALPMLPHWPVSLVRAWRATVLQQPQLWEALFARLGGSVHLGKAPGEQGGTGGGDGGLSPARAPGQVQAGAPGSERAEEAGDRTSGSQLPTRDTDGGSGVPCQRQLGSQLGFPRSVWRPGYFCPSGCFQAWGLSVPTPVALASLATLPRPKYFLLPLLQPPSCQLL